MWLSCLCGGCNENYSIRASELVLNVRDLRATYGKPRTERPCNGGRPGGHGAPSRGTGEFINVIIIMVSIWLSWNEDITTTILWTVYQSHIVICDWNKVLTNGKRLLLRVLLSYLCGYIEDTHLDSHKHIYCHIFIFIQVMLYTEISKSKNPWHQILLQCTSAVDN